MLSLSLFTPTFGFYRDASNNEADGLFFGNKVDAKVNVKGNVTFNSNGGSGMTLNVLFNQRLERKLDLVINSGATLNLDHNSVGLYATVNSFGELNVDVKENGSFESCGNVDRDIFGSPTLNSTYTFLGLGDGSYTCNQTRVLLAGKGTVVEPVCQPCT